MKIEDTYYWQGKRLWVARMRLANVIDKEILQPIVEWINNLFK